MIELLVVIAVIAILAAMLLPVLTRAKASARSVECKNHLHQMGLALGMYVGDFHKYPYYRYEGANQGYDLYWEDALALYYPLNWTNASYHCPSYTAARGRVTEKCSIIPANGLAVTHAPSVSGFTPSGFNEIEISLNLGLGGSGPSVLYPPLPATSEDQVLVPSEMFAISESRGYANPNFPGQFSGTDFMICAIHGMDSYLTLQPPQHGPNFNVLFCDGHVALVSTNHLFNATNTARYWNNDHQPHPETW